MNKFKQGDRVEIVTDEMAQIYAYWTGYPVKGDKGTIERVNEYVRSQPYLVRFDNGKHNGADRGWWCMEQDLRLVAQTNKFSPGALVRVIRGTKNRIDSYGLNVLGKTGVITVSTTSFGEPHHLLKFDDGSPSYCLWEDDLELLDSSQGVETVKPKHTHMQNITVTLTEKQAVFLYRLFNNNQETFDSFAESKQFQYACGRQELFGRTTGAMFFTRQDSDQMWSAVNASLRTVVTAPLRWTEQVPVIIGNDTVIFNSDKSITVGCTTVPKTTIDEIVKRLNT